MLVTGWQLAALKAGHLSYLRVPPAAVNGARRFLDRVQSADGARYGQTRPDDATEASTAIGLNSRILLGWGRKNPALVAGLQALDRRGPDFNDLGYTYWATAVVRDFYSDEWQRWNGKLRTPLVALQVVDPGHASGSWRLPSDVDPWHARGGRLYCTAMATLQLQSYYRRPPLLPPPADDDFPL